MHILCWFEVGLSVLHMSLWVHIPYGGKFRCVQIFAIFDDRVASAKTKTAKKNDEMDKSPLHPQVGGVGHTIDRWTRRTQ